MKRPYEHMTNKELIDFIELTGCRIAGMNPIRRPHTKALISMMNKSIKQAIEELKTRNKENK